LLRCERRRRHPSGSLRQIDGVDQFAEAAEIAPVRRENQARQSPNFRLVLFSWQCFTLDDLALANNIGKFLV